MRKHLLIALGAALLLAGCAGRAPQQPVNANPGDTLVRLTETRFKPDVLEVTAGETVSWVNEEGILHSVVEGRPEGGARLFQSADFGRGEAYRYTFRKPGTYAIFCRTANHHLMGMKMQVVVRE